MAVTVMEVLKRLPRTNCGDCGRPTCLAFATQVIKEGEDFEKGGQGGFPSPDIG